MGSRGVRLIEFQVSWMKTPFSYVFFFALQLGSFFTLGKISTWYCIMVKRILCILLGNKEWGGEKKPKSAKPSSFSLAQPQLSPPIDFLISTASFCKHFLGRGRELLLTRFFPFCREERNSRSIAYLLATVKILRLDIFIFLLFVFNTFPIR